MKTAFLKASALVLTIASSVACSRSQFDFQVPGEKGPSTKFSKITVPEQNVADGITPLLIEIQLYDEKHDPVPNVRLSLEVTGEENVIVPCTPTNAQGLARCWVFSTRAQWKSIRAVGSIILTSQSQFLEPAPYRSSFQFVASGFAETLPSGHKFVTSAGIVESDAVRKDINGKTRAHSSIGGALFGN